MASKLRELIAKVPHSQHTTWLDGIDVKECWPDCVRCGLEAAIAESEPLAPGDIVGVPKREPARSLDARADELFQAANTTAINLSTAMNLKEHPASCECYGCRLTKAVVNFALARAKENVRPIVERELEAEAAGIAVSGAQQVSGSTGATEAG